jgi:hypothetical protein
MNYNTKIALGAIGMIAIVLLILWYTGFFKKEKNTQGPDRSDAFRAGAAAVGTTELLNSGQNITQDDIDNAYVNASNYYNTLIGRQNVTAVDGCVPLDIASPTSPTPAMTAIQQGQNPCTNSQINQNGLHESHTILLNGNYVVDYSSSFITQGSPTTGLNDTGNIAEAGIYCCIDSDKAIAQDEALMNNFKIRKNAALRMKAAATAGAQTAIARDTAAVKSTRRYGVYATGSI